MSKKNKVKTDLIKINENCGLVFFENTEGLYGKEKWFVYAKIHICLFDEELGNLVGKGETKEEALMQAIGVLVNSIKKNEDIFSFLEERLNQIETLDDDNLNYIKNNETYCVSISQDIDGLRFLLQ